MKDLRNQLSEKKICILQRDFQFIQAIFIDEFSMVPLVVLAYLNKILQEVFWDRSQIMFAGIPIIISGDGYQLPCVQGKGILSPPENVPILLEETFNHFRNNTFYLELSKSVRQGSDLSYSDILMRLRTAQCTQEDVDILNTRFYPDLSRLTEEGRHWSKAPFLTGRNTTAHDMNAMAVHKNGHTLGAFCVHNLPILKKWESLEKKKEKIDKFFKKSGRTSSSRKGFTPESSLYVYPGMPVMLRANICPAVGLSNGSVGFVRAVRSRNMNPLETNEECRDRILSSDPEKSSFVPSLIVDFKNYYTGKISVLRPLAIMEDPGKIRTTVSIDPQVVGGVKCLPLSPAHAMTMHKCQSLTIPFCIIDPKEPFQMGQLYVAFSRAPKLAHIALTEMVTLRSLNKFRRACSIIGDNLSLLQKTSRSFEPFQSFIKKKENEFLSNLHCEE